MSLAPEANPTAYGPGMDARSTRVAEILNTPMLIAAALTLPMVAITESHPGGALEEVAIVLNWITWLAFAIELAVMLVVLPNRRVWLRHNPLSVVIVFLTPPVLPPGLQGLRALRLLRLLRLAQLSREVFSLRGLHYAALLAVLSAIGGGEIVSVVILIVGIGFVALLTGAFAQRFLGPEILQVEQQLEAEQLSVEAVALRELQRVREQVTALQIAVERLVGERARR